jgi:uncharacterized membrane protein YccC
VVLATGFFPIWIWPAGGSGGIWGDLLASAEYTLVGMCVATAVWPLLRNKVKGWVHRHFLGELHEKLDHLIRHSPEVPPYERKP